MCRCKTSIARLWSASAAICQRTFTVFLLYTEAVHFYGGRGSAYVFTKNSWNNQGFFFSSFLTTDFLPCLPDLSQSDADAVVLINLTNTEVTCFTSCLPAVICQEWVTPSHTGSRPSAPVVTVISVWWTLWRHQAKGKLSSRQDNWRWSLRN